MSNAEQVALGTTLAGVNQYKVFSAVMTNFKTAIKATNDAIHSNNSASKENEKYMESIQARLQSLKAELEKFILAENSLQQVAKVILGDLVKITKALNTFGGKITLVSVLLIATLDALISKLSVLKGLAIVNSLKEIGQLISTFLIPQIQKFGVTALFSADAVDVLNISLEALNLNPYMLAITAVIALLAAGAYAIHKYNHALDEQKDKFDETVNSLEDHASKLDNYKEELKATNSEVASLTKELEKLNNIQGELSESEKEHKDQIEKKLRSLESEQVATENLIRLEEKLRDEQQKRADEQGNKTLHTHRNWGASEDSNIIDILEGKGYITNEQAYGNKNKDTVQTLKVYASALENVSKEYERVKASRDEFADDEEYQETLAQVNQDYLDIAGATSKIAEEVYGVRDSVSQESEAWKYATEGIEAYENAINLTTGVIEDGSTVAIDSLDDLEDEVDEFLGDLDYASEEGAKAVEFLHELSIKENELQKQIGMSSIELVKQAEQWRTNAETLYNYLIDLNHFNESMDNIQNTYKTLQSAVDEYNESGGYSIDTIQTLLSMSPEYIEMLEEENGVMKLNTNALKSKTESMALEAKQMIYNNAVERIKNLTTDEGTKQAIIHKEEFDKDTNAIKNNSDALIENAKAEFANTVAKARRGSVRDTYINQIIKETQEQIALVDKMVEGLGKDFSKSMGGATNSTKDTNNALKEQNNLLKQQKQLLEEKKKQYESVVAYIKKKIQDEIKSIEAEKKAQVDAIKDQIEALKDLKEEELDRIQEQIDALKDQKDVEKEYWQSKIDALKEQNDELKDQLEYEELLENLAKAKAKRVRVYKDGKFTYTEDSNEVDKAQAKIEEYERKKSYEEQLKVLENYKKQSENNYDEQIKALEQLKKDKEKNYDQQIKDLEKYQEQVEADYDARIKYFQDYLDKFTKETDAYENETNRQLAIQLTGIDFEQQGWQTRLDNLSDFVEKYNALLGDINSLDDTDLGTDDTTTTTTKTPQENDGNDDDSPKDTRKEKGTYTSISSSTDLSKNAKSSAVPVKTLTTQTVSAKAGISSGISSLQAVSSLIKKKASGDSYISDDGMYLVGDSPNQELVIGSKLNGNLMNLTQGSGVVNATATRTLAGMLNQLGFANQGVNMSNSQNKSTNINIGNISLPSVQNGKDFVDYLQNFSLQMTQEAFA